ncbi:DUF305 domain-containing protein [uncultured Psychrobacter sp.]|uniref:CopM family metallochaperone n=1 Tax=uncultured Psychrobacter sp. TaxID=259303 RepID=UPI00260F6D25|nr:DUF305 domain-containing protein [uncultured Psychrobacter sp.]
MIAIKRSRLAVVTASLSAILALSACGPANDDAAPTPKDAAAASDLHDQHHINGKDLAMDDDIAHSESSTAMYQAYNDSMTKMHSEMMLGMGYNDPDSAFTQGMLGHHLGAVDMANIQLKYGKDPEMLQLAQKIIDAQEVEIKQMQNWLNSHPDVAAPMADTGAMQQAYATGMNDMHGEMTLGITDPNPDMAFARGFEILSVVFFIFSERVGAFGEDIPFRAPRRRRAENDAGKKHAGSLGVYRSAHRAAGPRSAVGPCRPIWPSSPPV